MALKDLLTDALQATPPENAARLATLRAVLAISGGGSDAEIQAALTRQIAEREQKAASFAAAGQTELARTERGEIDTLRGYLRKASPEAANAPASTPKKPKASKPADEPAAEVEAAKPLLTRNQLAIGGVILIAVIAALFFVFRSGSPDAEQTASSGGGKWTITSDDRTMGNPKAPIVMIEYAAPTCPHCAHFDATVLPHVKEEYIDTGKVFYVFRVYPIQPSDGAIEALARTCLPADKYFQFLDLMFRNQSKWDPDGYQIPDVHGAIVQMSRLMGISPDQADQCMTNQKELDRVNQVALDAQNRYAINGTPTFIINGTVVTTAEGTWPLLKARFDSLLAKK